ncbi:hypothetical protein HRbin09_01481 [bacterium HR09]|nr:hypothetical protein HRbin09_01481 [bacterium HR09]
MERGKRLPAAVRAHKLGGGGRREDEGGGAGTVCIGDSAASGHLSGGAAQLDLHHHGVQGGEGYGFDHVKVVPRRPHLALHPVVPLLFEHHPQDASPVNRQIVKAVLAGGGVTRLLLARHGYLDAGKRLALSVHHVSPQHHHPPGLDKAGGDLELHGVGTLPEEGNRIGEVGGGAVINGRRYIFGIRGDHHAGNREVLGGGGVPRAIPHQKAYHVAGSGTDGERKAAIAGHWRFNHLAGAGAGGHQPGGRLGGTGLTGNRGGVARKLRVNQG